MPRSMRLGQALTCCAVPGEPREQPGSWSVRPNTSSVLSPEVPPSPWLRPMRSQGDAVITIIDCVGDACWSRPSIFPDSAAAILGVLRRSSSLGTALTLVAQAEAATEVSFPAWSAPTADPKCQQPFGDAPDATARCLGQTDTGWPLWVETTRSTTADR